MAPVTPDIGREPFKNKLSRFAPIVIIVFVSLGLYCNSLFNGFVYDDPMQVVENPWIRDARYLSDIFSKNAWSFKSQLVVSNYYRPFMHVINMFNYHLFGLNAWGFHLVNILIHSANSVLVFLIASRLFSEFPTKGQVLTPALTSPVPSAPSSTFTSTFLGPPFLAALLFASHPIHTEAVAWIGGIPDLSFAFFFLLSFYFYIRSGRNFNLAYLFSAVSFSIATLCKEPALTLPLILAVYDYILNKERGCLSDFFKRYIPFLVVGAGYFLVRFHALGGFAPDKRHADLSVYQYVINVFPLFIQYLEKLLFPVNLNAFYVFHPVSSILEMRGILCLTATAAFIVASLAVFKRSKAVFFSLLLIVIPLLPVLYIPGLSVNIFTERYLYLPSAGFVMLSALFVARTRGNHPKWAASLAVGAVIVAGLYTMGTVNRNAIWRDDYTLWADTARKSPDGALVHVNFGQALQMRGQRDEAIEQYQIALRLNPNDPITHFNLGLAFFLKGGMDMAIEQFQITLSQDPDYSHASYYLQLALSSKQRL